MSSLDQRQGAKSRRRGLTIVLDAAHENEGDGHHSSPSCSALRSSTGSKDSQHDIETAVNTPFATTPSASKRNLGEGSPDNDADWEKIMTRNEDATELEAGLKERTREDGLRRHTTTASGVKERTDVLDLGNGPEEVVLIEWLENDPQNPFNWPQWRKYLTTFTAVLITLLTAANCTSVAIMTTWGPERFDTTREGYILSLTVFMISVSFTPMVLAPLSEAFGRNMIYQITSVITALLFVPQATSNSYSGLLAARWFQGMSSSVGNSMVGGTIADLFRAEDRGLGMNVFSLMVFVGQGLGGIVFGWVGMYWGIPWCYGVQGIAAIVSCILNALVLRETRGDVLLTRRARQLTKETGRRHACAADLQRRSFATLLAVSLIRPFQYLFTEPIVSALSTWIAFAWACIFLGGTSVLLVFQQYGFNYGQLGSCQTTVVIGGLLGFISNFHQEHLYALSAHKLGRAPPEARLYWAAYGGLMFPLAMFGFAWTGRPDIPWPVPAAFLCIANWGVYCMYSGVFNYLADAYETYSSSAQAAQSWARNIFSGVFPLFAHQMYTAMGYPQATTLIAAVALALSVAPILLLRYGKRLRARSKITSALVGNTS